MAPLKVFEVDEHHHVLLSPEITSTVQEGSTRGGVLLNFDSHDDWGMSLAKQSKVTPQELRELLKAGDRRVLDHVEIGTWILPLAALGAYDSLIWVTKWANIKRESFEALVGFNDNGMVRVTGANVPAAWRALWGDTYVSDWPAHHAHRVRFIILDSAKAASYLRSSSCPRSSRWTVSMDLDFFTVCNSGRDSLNEIPGDRTLKADLWRLATAVPLVKVFDFYDALHGYYTGNYQLVEATDMVEECAQGTAWQSGPPVDRSFVENCLRRSFKRISRQWLVMLTSSSHLADHRSSDEEVDVLMDDFKQCLQAVLKKRGVDRPQEILVARSEDYRHRGYAVRQQANAIRDRTVQLIQELMPQ